MRPTLIVLSLVAALAVAPPGSAQEQGGSRDRSASQGSVSGTVVGRFEGRVTPLPFALVEAWGDDVKRSVVTDSLGRYHLSGLAPGSIRLKATHAGHRSVTVDVIVPRDGPVLVDLELRGQPVELPPIDVVTDPRIADADPRRPDARDADELAVGRIETAALEIGSGGADAGLADALRAFGGQDPPEASDVLFMRGSTTDLKLVLLDGAPVYTPFHVAGLLKSFEPAVLGRADLHVGGAPARYDGGLTYILDLRTRRPRPDRVHASGSLDLLAGSVALDAPLGSHGGLIVSARSLHDLASGPLGASPYGYREALTTLEVEPSPGHVVKATGFWNRESVVLDLPQTAFASPGLGPGALDELPDEARWSNRVGAASYRTEAGNFRIDANVAGSTYEAALPIQPSATDGQADPEPILASAKLGRLRAGVEVARPMSWGMLRLGLTFDELDTRYEAESVPTDSGVRQNIFGSSRAAGGYVDVTRVLGSDFTARVGTRLDHFSGDGAFRVAPRASLTWRVGPEAFLTVAAGRYHQAARATDASVETSLAFPTDGAGESAPGFGSASGLGTDLPVATADHVVVSLDQSFGDDVVLGLAGFWKGYDGLGPSEGKALRSSGIDLRARRRGRRTTTWLGYGLSWYWSRMNPGGSSSDFTGRHLLSAGLSTAPQAPLGVDIQVAYGAGLPYTSVPINSLSPVDPPVGGSTEIINETPPFSGGLDEDFLRVDVEFHGLITPRWGGREWEIRPYLKILNALDRRDALFYAFQPWRGDGLTPLAERTLVPVLGVAWRF